MKVDPQNLVRSFATADGTSLLLSLPQLQNATGLAVNRLPYCRRLLLENTLWLAREKQQEADLTPFQQRADGASIPFCPVRILMQDFTGVPCIVDMAALRQALHAAGVPAAAVQPRLPVDLVIDHSVQLDQTASPEALQNNMHLEMQRNTERYRLLKWSAGAFSSLRIFPPGTGICHQINVELLTTVVRSTRSFDGQSFQRPDSVLGTDSHTTTVNALGVIGWGIGGIEAEAILLGEVPELPLPPVTGVRLAGRLPEEVSATDLALAVTRRLRQEGVVGHMVEFFGEGVRSLSVPDRIPVANMAPEYGATCGFFPVDNATLDYLRRTGRDPKLVATVETYCTAQNLFRHDPEECPEYDRVVEIDLRSVEISVSGPRRPHQVVAIRNLEQYFNSDVAPAAGRGHESATPARDSDSTRLQDGDVVIASITSCTNTSSPALLVAAALLARRAREAGLSPPAHVRTSFAPGSRAALLLLQELGLMDDLEALGFHACAFGCATCIGNSGPLPEHLAAQIKSHDLTVAAVLSGNRNFEARIHPLVKANFLCSPALVVAFALQGHIRSNPLREPLTASSGRSVRLAELWPSAEEIRRLLEPLDLASIYRRAYAHLSTPEWEALPAPADNLYQWDPDSTYVRRPPYFEPAPDCRPAERYGPIRNARCLALFGDFITTDHISPAGAIAPDSPAGRYLQQRGVRPEDFNTFGSRRGNHEVMVRGTFGNPRLRNLMASRNGSWTVYYPSGQELPIFDAAQKYAQEGVPLLVIAGKMYGAGSSRDWAAKGTALLGVRAVIAESFERIHRANLVEMGVLPLQFQQDQNASSLGLTGEEEFDVIFPEDDPSPAQAQIVARGPGDRVVKFPVRVLVHTAREWDYLRYGGILPLVYCHLRSRASD